MVKSRLKVYNKDKAEDEKSKKKIIPVETDAGLFGRSGKVVLSAIGMYNFTDCAT